MSSMDKRQDAPNTGPQVGVQIASMLQSGNQSGQPSKTDQLSFPDAAAQVPTVTRPLTEPAALPNVTRQLKDFTPIPPTVTTQSLPEVLSNVKPTTTSLREPVLIRGRGRRMHPVRPPQGRRLVVHVAVTVLLALCVLVALVLVAPTGGDKGGTLGNIFPPITNLINSKGNNAGLIAQQAATATAVTQDGYDPGNGQTYAGVPTAPPGSGYAGQGGVGNHFFFGQCTYWASMRYYQLTGHWVPWLGNAWQWAAGAGASGWVISGAPHLHSIIVLQPNVQGAGWYGHVAIVEQINADGSVLTSNFNWAGAWGRETFVTFKPGPGVSFVWMPGF